MDKYFTAKPQIVSLAFFLTCICIEAPFVFQFKIASFGDYKSNDNPTQVKTFYYYTSSDFSTTLIGQLLNGLTQVFLNQFLSLVVGLILNIVSVWLYRSYLKERRQRDEAHRSVAYSNSNQIDIATTHIASPRQNHVLTPKELLERKAEKNMFYMALTLCTISIISRVLYMICFVFYFLFKTPYNFQIIIFTAYLIQVLGPTLSIFVFYFFNNMFRQEFKKRISTPIVGSSSAQR